MIDKEAIMQEINEKAKKEALHATASEVATTITKGVGVASGIIMGGGALYNPHVNRTGDLSADSQIMSLKEPFIMVKRNAMVSPSNDSLGHLEGFPAYTKCKLSACKGFTVVDKVIVNVNCTDEERAEIERLLKQGVYL